jgi:hypothetical protein
MRDAVALRRAASLHAYTNIHPDGNFPAPSAASNSPVD